MIGSFETSEGGRFVEPTLELAVTNKVIVARPWR
jgi:hypothetical protein